MAIPSLWQRRSAALKHDIFITGSTGFLGRHVHAALTADFRDQRRIHVVSRKAAPQLEHNDRVRFNQGDLNRESDLARFLSGPGILLNLAYSADALPKDSVSAARLLVKYAAKAGVRRIIHCSTAVVVGNSSDDPVVESSHPEPVSEYEQTKLDVEQIFLNESPLEIEVFVLRPTAVFGPGGKNIVKLVRDRTSNSALRNYLLDCIYGERAMNLVSVRQVVASLLHFLAIDSAAMPAPVREVMICSADSAPENNYRFLSQEIRKRFRTNELPLPKLSAVAKTLPLLLRLAGRSNTNPNRKYISSSATHLGFHYEGSFPDELREYLDWLRSSGEIEQR